MRQKKLSAPGIVAALHAFETGVAESEICGQWGISASTLYKWRRRYAGMPLVAVAQIESFIHENAQLRQQISRLELDRNVLSKAIEYQSLSPEQRRTLIYWLRKQLRVSHARVCRLVGMSRSFFAYQAMHNSSTP